MPFYRRADHAIAAKPSRVPVADHVYAYAEKLVAHKAQAARSPRFLQEMAELGAGPRASLA